MSDSGIQSDFGNSVAALFGIWNLTGGRFADYVRRMMNKSPFQHLIGARGCGALSRGLVHLLWVRPT